MSSVLRGTWDAVSGLLIEDGSLAVGILVALAITWLVSALVPEPAHDQIGWLLVAILVGLVLFNVRAAGVNARRVIAGR